LTRRWKSSGELVATIRVNRKARATEPFVRTAPKAAERETCGATNRNRIGGGATQGERANDRVALATKESFRRSGARAGTANESYLGRSRPTSERRTSRRESWWSEKSAAAIVAAGFGAGEPPQSEGPNSEEGVSTVRYDKARHQKANEQFELPLDGWGEAPSTQRSGEATSAAQGNEHSGLGEAQLMERIVERGNLTCAFKRVRRNQGGPGVDGMTVDELPAYLKQHWPRLREELLTGRYQPSAVLREEIPKSDGGMRTLGIPTVLDRFIQQAVLQVMQPRIDPTFSEHRYGFRPSRSAHQAVCQAQRYVQSGRRWVVDIDLEKFFDRVNHDRLMGRVAHHIADGRVLTLIRRYLDAGIMVNGVVMERHEGTPQGGPLSPMLANVLLDDGDKALERRGHRFVRYADDCNVYVQTKRAAERVMEGLVGLYAKLKLQVNVAKSAVARAVDRSFLSYSFWVAPGKLVKRRVSPNALIKMKERVRASTARNGGRSLAQVAAELRSYLVGWKSYFRLADTPSVFADVDKWLHRRLRMLMLKQWRRGRTMYRELKRRGVSDAVAAMAARFGRSWWHVAGHKALHIALPGKYFDSLGVPRLAPSSTSTH
jgi:RNA-directed DNA polymerase